MKLYTPLINRVLKIAYDAHHGQVDKGGVPYVFHPAFLAAQMDTEEDIITALLHDVVEDTSVSFADLEREGIPQTVLDALKMLTHIDGGDYMQYINELTKNPLAVKVKLADLRHNTIPTRSETLPPEVATRLKAKNELYAKAILLLENHVVMGDAKDQLTQINTSHERK